MKKTLLITGANGNIGSSLATEFLMDKEISNDYDYFILLVNSAKNRILELVNQNKDRSAIIECDLTEKVLFDDKVDRLRLQHNLSLKGLIHTAAIRSVDFSLLKDTDPELWFNIVKINLLSTYNVLRYFLNRINYNNDTPGRIILFGSNVSRIGLPKGSAYSCTKAAISNLTRTVAQESPHVLINCLSPGPVDTDFSDFDQDYQSFRKQYFSEKLHQIPLKRLVKYNDIYQLCKFLITKTNNYITGEEFFVTGGCL